MWTSLSWIFDEVIHYSALLVKNYLNYFLVTLFTANFSIDLLLQLCNSTSFLVQLNAYLALLFYKYDKKALQKFFAIFFVFLRFELSVSRLFLLKIIFFFRVGSAGCWFGESFNLLLLLLKLSLEFVGCNELFLIFSGKSVPINRYESSI